MIVYQCDAIGCAATASPRRVRTIEPDATGRSRIIERMMLPIGWFELRSFEGLDREVEIRGKVEKINPGSTSIFQLDCRENFQLTDVFVRTERAQCAQDLRVSTLKLGRLEYYIPEPVPIDEIPREAKAALMRPWSGGIQAVIVNRSLAEVEACLCGKGYLMTVGGTDVELNRVALVCPDHVPKTNNRREKRLFEDYDGHKIVVSTA
jgi:hypothetical protein